ncbi:LD-carboxypeptidase [Lysinibacillus macroides]|uniref:Peptidase S66 n=1 Tax=Lysinibacillus macroides TaxID=33935 RepID=A0A0M9DHS0_9BACI|nr:LD-carboxypeptidase [Lysinibacillus macroides]KOY80696.1 peptidase S66 [Lysinibacillus macroides]QPR69835.1 LD-carboxypeptidase [Lysinibacillus macroides]
MIRPRPLKKGDTVGLISVSGAVPPEKVQPAIASIERLGLKVVAGETCYAHQGYFAGTATLRAADVHRMFRDPTINGIFCMRGGYGATKILPQLDFDMIRAHPKVFAGYSDVTALHIAFNQLCGFITYHTPMPSTEFIKQEMDAYTWQSFKQHMMTEEAIHLENPVSQPMTTLVAGCATGQLVGGNLTLVAASLGTPYDIDTKGKILFLEDIDENSQRIDRMFTQLKLAGKFDEAAGILLGAWTNCGEHSVLQTIFREMLVSLNKPIIADIACGHCLPTMSLPLGATIVMDADHRRIIAFNDKETGT